MLAASASWKEPREWAKPLWERAWTELQRIAPEERDRRWRETALSVTAHVAYPTFRELAAEKLETTTEAFWRVGEL
jgi:hypothetical protein